MNAAQQIGAAARDQPAATVPESWRICGVIVAFHPDEQFGQRLARIAAQVDGVVVVDNGGGPGLDPADERIGWIRNQDNLGVAAALNQGVRHAMRNGYTHALLFDQDTDPLPHMVDALRAAARGRPDLESVAVIGCNFLDAGTGRPGLRLSSTAPVAEVRAAITSGSLLPLRAAASLGPFREDFFIDMVDDEFCLRARSRGYKILLVGEPLAVHALGAPRFRRLLGRTIATSNHPADRRYYMIRNYVIVLRTYGWREPGWTLRTAWIRLKTLATLVIVDDHRLAKMRAMWRGFRDGLANRTGAVPRSPLAPR